MVRVNFIDYLLTEILQEKGYSPTRSSHDPGYIYLIKAVGFHGLIPGCYLGRYKIGLSRDPNSRLEDFYDNQPPCDLKIIRTIAVRDMKAIETILHKQFQKRRVNLKGRRTSEWFDLNLAQLWQVRHAYYKCERHPKLGTIQPHSVPTPALIVAGLVGLIAIATVSTQVSLQPKSITTEQNQ
jgi:hypothetical protein